MILFLRGVLTIPLNSAIVYHRGGVPSLVRMLCGDAEPVAGKAGKAGKAEGHSKRRRRRDRGEEGGSGGNSDKEELPSLLGTLYMYGRGVSGSLAVVFLVSAFTQYVMMWVMWFIRRACTHTHTHSIHFYHRNTEHPERTALTH